MLPDNANSVPGHSKWASPLSNCIMSPELLAEARRIASQPILIRAYRADDVPLEYRDTRALALTNNRREWFLLSMSDLFQTRVVDESLLLVALAAKETGDPILTEYCLAQLEELKNWHPLNRPGWGLYQPGPPVPENYNDGNWLGTGGGIRAITNALGVLGNLVPPKLRTALHQLLKQEINGVRDDFQTHRVWYWNSPVSNQFVVPNCGVLQACVALGKKPGDNDYEFAMTNLLSALNAQGKDGAFHEGAMYGAVTNSQVLSAAHKAALSGDARLIEHSHMQNFGRWLLHSVQPGSPPMQARVVNTFDGGVYSLEVSHDNPAQDSLHPMNSRLIVSGTTMLDALMLHAMATNDAQVVWFLNEFVPLLPTTATLAEYSMWQAHEKPTAEMPPTFASYSSSPLSVWRSSWENGANGVWVRGGSAQDSHDHADRGHVNLIFKGREILIEAGSTDYATPDFTRIFGSGLGHNVLQIGSNENEASAKGGMAKSGCDAPIEVLRLDADGGEVVVNATAAYNSELLHWWTRRVRWNDREVTIDDEVQLAPDVQEEILFRFHLGQEATPKILSTADAHGLYAQWKGGAIRFCSNKPLSLTTDTHPHGLSYTKTATHTVLLPSSREKVNTLHLTTTLTLSDF